MIITLAKFQTLIKKVQEIKEDQKLYCLDPNRIPVSLDDIVYVVKEKYEVSISVSYVDFEGEYLRGMLERSDKHVDIYIRESQIESWQRFIIVKEIGHIVIDEPEDWAIDPVNTIDGVLLHSVLGSSKDDEENNAPPEVQSERLATVAAAELLFPYELRAAARTQLQNGEISMRRLALDFEIPDSVVSWILSDTYMAIIEKVRGTLPELNA